MADDQFERIKTLTIIALVSDDEFMERLVLKGGNALRLLGEISSQREFHRENFAAVIDTVDPAIKLERFDFYVDFVVDKLRPLQARWEIQPPL